MRNDLYGVLCGEDGKISKDFYDVFTCGLHKKNESGLMNYLTFYTQILLQVDGMSVLKLLILQMLYFK